MTAEGTAPVVTVRKIEGDPIACLERREKSSRLRLELSPSDRSDDYCPSRSPYGTLTWIPATVR